MKKICILLAALALINAAAAQEKKEVEKTGFSFGGFPIVAFDQDKGLQLGALANIYDFGKGGWYPNPRQQLYVEASWFTKAQKSSRSLSETKRSSFLSFGMYVRRLL